MSTQKRAVILGASGFVGRNLKQALSQKNWLVLAPTSQDLNLTERGSSQKLEALLKPNDALIFISALTPDRGRDVKTMLANLEMGSQVAKAIQASPPAYVLYVSSDAVYSDDFEVVTERTPTAPNNYHGFMHLGRELMLKEACGAKIPLGIVRSVAVYGPGDTHNSYGPNRFLKTAKETQEIVLFGEGEERRDHIHIKDLTHILVQTLEQNFRGVLNAASGKSPSFFEVAQAIQKRAPNTKIQMRPRATPITHKHFDTTTLVKTFGQHVSLDINAGLSQYGAGV